MNTRGLQSSKALIVPFDILTHLQSRIADMSNFTDGKYSAHLRIELSLLFERTLQFQVLNGAVTLGFSLCRLPLGFLGSPLCRFCFVLTSLILGGEFPPVGFDNGKFAG